MGQSNTRHDSSGRRRFTVEQAGFFDDDGEQPRFAIRYTPAPRTNADGSTSYGLSFPFVEATEWLGDAEAILSEIADILEKHYV